MALRSLPTTTYIQFFAADPVYVKGEVFAYVGLLQNLKDLKDGRRPPPLVPARLRHLLRV